MFYIISPLFVTSVFDHTSGIVVLGAEVSPKMPRMKRKAVPEGNDPVPRDMYGLGGLTLEKIRRTFA